MGVLAAIIICVFAAIVVLEILSLTVGLNKVVFRAGLDMDLTEPGEELTLTYRVGNTAFFPLMFVSFSFLFDSAVEVREGAEWMERHRTGSLINESYTFDTYLMPHSNMRGRIRLSIKQRGHYRIGKVYVEVGDFLGFTTRLTSYDLGLDVVCTARPCEDEPDITALGGLLGDISVRRFIMEDPSLVLGYREYTGAEPLKAISWPQTAKTGRLMVRKHDFTVDNDVAVLVDIEHTEKEVQERCLSLLRTACDRLEEDRIPYALHSNGDLFDTEKGSGRLHNFGIQRRIGVSQFVRYRPFSSVIERGFTRSAGRSGAIVIVPKLDEENERLIRRLSESTGIRVCLLEGRRDEE